MCWRRGPGRRRGRWCGRGRGGPTRRDLKHHIRMILSPASRSILSVIRYRSLASLQLVPLTFLRGRCRGIVSIMFIHPETTPPPPSPPLRSLLPVLVQPRPPGRREVQVGGEQPGDGIPDDADLDPARPVLQVYVLQQGGVRDVE